jgi:class 3 adenylate cyclase
MRAPDVSYALADGAYLAYRVVDGSSGGANDVVLITAGTMPMDAYFDDPVASRLVEGLADLGRLVMFDRRGVGISDPPADGGPATVERWCEDLDAVIAAAGARRPVLVSNMLAAAVTIVFSALHPDDLTALVLVDPSDLHRLADQGVVQAQIAGEFDSVAMWGPSRADEPGFRAWFERAGQRGASPRMAERVYVLANDATLRMVEDAAASLRVPTLVLRRPAHWSCPVRSEDPIMARLPDAIRVDLPGEDVFIFGGEVDAVLAEVHRFVVGEHRLPAPERVLAAVLYSDLVASTARATALGDAHWKRLLDIHDDVARSCIARRGGIVIKTLGDGFLATLPSATSSLLAAQELRAALLEHQLETRIGIHIGDVQLRGDDISGAGAVIAARIVDLAESGEILASNIAVGAATGSPLQFESRGEYELKGIPGTWQLFAVAT